MEGKSLQQENGEEPSIWQYVEFIPRVHEFVLAVYIRYIRCVMSLYRFSVNLYHLKGQE